jgi:hypothetical protein
MKLNLKYTAIRVDEIEQTKQLPIENCIADNTIGNIALFIQKGLVNDSGSVGVSKAQALTVIDEYLAQNDKDELMMDIMEALIDGGFLSRDLDVAKVRKLKAKRQEQLTEEINNAL